jgi:hypothetical protein
MRIYVFIIMCLLLGYSANVSAIKVEPYDGTAEVISNTAGVLVGGASVAATDTVPNGHDLTDLR